MLPSTDIIPDAFQLCLLITERCNLKCSYCYCDRTRQNSMTRSTAKAKIADIIAEQKEIKKLHILLMGGEPFMEFDLIKDLVAYVHKKFNHTDIFFKAVSNGTLIHGEIQEWLLNHQDIFQVELSIDGPESIQNTTRSNSFQKIDLPFFTQKIKSPVSSTVITPENLLQLAENVQYLEGKGFWVKAVIADGVDWSDTTNTKLFALQLKKLINYYIQNPQQQPFSLLGLATYGVNSNIKLSKCQPGKTSIAISPDGNTYACHRCTAYYNTGDWKIPEEELALNETYLHSACKQCCVKDICNSCPASIAALKYAKKQKEAKCLLSKTLFYANAYFHIHLLLKSPNHQYLIKRASEQKQAMLNGARYILDHLNPQVPF